MDNRFKLMLGFAVSGMALLGVAVFFIVGGGDLDSMMMAQVALVLILVAGTTKILIDRTRDVREGMPPEDELSKKVAQKAGYHTYLITIWIAVGLLWYNTLISDKTGMTPLDSEETIGVIVLLSGIVFIGLALIYGKRGIPE